MQATRARSSPKLPALTAMGIPGNTPPSRHPQGSPGRTSPASRLRAAGWIAVGVSALRVDRVGATHFEGATS